MDLSRLTKSLKQIQLFAKEMTSDEPFHVTIGEQLCKLAEAAILSVLMRLHTTIGYSL
jgi:hypothetical protein